MEPPRADERLLLARELGIDPLAAQCLLNRGIEEPSAAREFLEGGLNSLLRPEDLPDMPAAVARLRRAVAERERVCVWGDYDVDGVSGTAILVRFLRMLGADARPFIPERTGSGYGFHWPTMQRIIAEGVTLFVSVDHGSAAVEPVTRAAAAGIDVVIADHHEMSPVLPPAVAVINPKRPDSRYGFDSLCGAGVAMKLAWAVAQDLSPGSRVSEHMREFLLDALATAVLGTVADVVPLRGENRIIVRHGLKVMAARPRPGLAALLDVSGARGGLRASDVAFKLGPRLNAAGRMGSASAALELLLTDDPARARELAGELDRVNQERRAIEREVAQEARDAVIRRFGRTPAHAVAIMSDRWHHGVIGIVAARLVDEFHVPAVLVSTSGGIGRGSARSVRGFALHEALAACGEHLVAHGGHAGAAGLTVEPERFPAFEEAFLRYAQSRREGEDTLPTLRIDAECTVEEVTPRLATSLARLEPFGEGNPAPVLALRGVDVAGRPRTMGTDGEHVAFFVSRGGRALRCVAFRQAEQLRPLLESGRAVDLAFTPEMNAWRGGTDVEAHVRDLRESGSG